MDSDLIKIINQLQEEIETLKLQVAEDTKEKYRLYKRIKDLTESKDPIY